MDGMMFLKSAQLKRGAFLQFENLAKTPVDYGLEDKNTR